MLEGVTDLAEQVFHLPVRIGVPLSVAALADVVSSPMYAAGVGLLLYGLRRSAANGSHGGRFWSRVRHRVDELFREIF